LCAEMVRAEGLEPPHLSTTGPKPAASTNSATRGDAGGGGAYNRRGRMGNPAPKATHCSQARSGARRAIHATTSGRTADDAGTGNTRTVAARPADRDPAGNSDTFAGHRRALATVAGDQPVARSDIACGLGAQ